MTWPATVPERAKKAPAGRRFHGGLQSELRPSLAFHLPALAGGDHGGGIDGFTVFLYLQNLTVLIDEESHPTSGMILRIEDADLFGQVATPVAENGKFKTFFLCPRGVAERAVHANTQNLGVCGFQFF